MSKTRRCRYGMDPRGETAAKSAGFMGIAMFLRIVYFFALTRLESTQQFVLIVGLVLPVAIEVTYLVMIKALRLNNPWLYAVIGAVQMVLLIVNCTQHGDVLRLVLGILVYVACGAGLVTMAAGVLNNKLVQWGLIFVAVGKVLIFNLSQNILTLQIVPLVFEVAGVMELLALCAFAASLHRRK